MPSAEVFNQRDGAIHTDSQGHPVGKPYAAQRAGQNGPLLLQDFALIDALSHFNRERIPERVVHAKGGGAHGTFEVTDPLDDLTCAELLSKRGNKCSATVRFSTVGGESGSADTARDPRGFSVKLRTEQGIWDHVYNNTPVFFLRDPAKFPRFVPVLPLPRPAPTSSHCAFRTGSSTRRSATRRRTLRTPTTSCVCPLSSFESSCRRSVPGPDL